VIPSTRAMIAYRTPVTVFKSLFHYTVLVSEPLYVMKVSMQLELIASGKGNCSSVDTHL